MNDWRVLSLWQPWASAIARGLKQNETRSWSTDYRGPIAIHAAKRSGQALRDFAWQMGMRWDDLPRGAIVAVARLVSVDRISGRAVHTTEREAQWGNYALGRYVWRLEDIRALREPMPYRGAQHLRKVEPSVIEALDSYLQGE